MLQLLRRLPLRRAVVFFFKLAIKKGQNLSIEYLAMNLQVSLVKNRPNSIHSREKGIYGLTVTLTVI